MSHVYGRYSTYIHDRTYYDLFYISHYSLPLDFKILLLTTLYFGKVVYTEYAAARAYIVLTYPEIASSSYPDGERFTVYTLSEDSKIEAALQKMQAEGKYQSYTVEDIKDHLFLYSYLKDSAGASVSAARSAGNDYTYVANEYRLTYIQQHDYKNRNIFKRIFSPDYSADFLKALVDVNRERIAEVSGGLGGFKALTDMGELEGYDYGEEVQEYRARVNAIINFLNTLENNSPGFAEDVLEDYDVEEHINTYDNIVLSYADRASAASDARHTIDYYNKIIDSYTNDKVAAETKERLTEKNEEIFKEIAQYSEKYCTVANQTINEMFYTEINDDLQYLILPEVTADKPVKLIAVFVTVLVFGLLLVAALLYELTKRVAATANAANEEKNEKLQIDTSGMSRLHQLVYEQYRADFKDFYLVYQPMKGGGENDREHLEALIRWRSDELGMVSPAKLIECIADFGIFPQLNDWIIKNVCADIFYIAKEKGRAPIVHINCPSGQLSDFALNDIIIRHISENSIPAECICLELEVADIASALEDITLLENMGVGICIDKFENTNEEREIINVLEPQYIKMSLDSLHADIYASTTEDYKKLGEETEERFEHIISECRSHGIKACICGVETEEQDRLVTRLGFDYKQGYFYGKPEALKKEGV